MEIGTGTPFVGLPEDAVDNEEVDEDEDDEGADGSGSVRSCEKKVQALSPRFSVSANGNAKELRNVF